MSASPLNIGQAADRSGLTPKMIRHYERTGLLPPALRSGNGYRLYAEDALDTLGFIKRARDLGFSLDEIRELLALRRNPARASADVQALARQHVQALDERIERLLALRESLQRLVDQCHGNAAPECAILDELASAKP